MRCHRYACWLLLLAAIAALPAVAMPGLPRRIDQADTVLIVTFTDNVKYQGVATWLPATVDQVLRGTVPDGEVQCHVSYGWFGSPDGSPDLARPGTSCLAVVSVRGDRLDCGSRGLLPLPPAALRALADKPDLSERLRPALFTAIGDGTTRYAAHALAWLGMLPVDRATLALLRACTTADKSWATRDAAWQALLACGCQDLPDGLPQHLDAGLSAYQTAMWVSLIGEVSHSSGVRLLPSLRSVRNPGIRAAVAEGLASQQWSEAIPALMDLFGDGPPLGTTRYLACALGGGRPMPEAEQYEAAAWRSWWEREGRAAFSRPAPPSDEGLTKPLFDPVDGPAAVVGRPDLLDSLPPAAARLQPRHGEKFAALASRLAQAGTVVAWPDQPERRCADSRALEAWLYACAQANGWRLRRAEPVLAMAPPNPDLLEGERGFLDRANCLLDWLDSLTEAQYRLLRGHGLVPWADLIETQRSQWLASSNRGAFVSDSRVLDRPPEQLALVVEPAGRAWLRYGETYPTLNLNGSNYGPSGAYVFTPDTVYDLARLQAWTRAARAATQPDVLRLTTPVKVARPTAQRFATAVSLAEVTTWLREQGLRFTVTPQAGERRLRLALPASASAGHVMQAAAWATDCTWRNVDGLWHLAANQRSTVEEDMATRQREPGPRRALRVRLLRHTSALWPDRATLPPATSGYEDLWLPLSRLAPVWRERLRSLLLGDPGLAKLGLPTWQPAALEQVEVSFGVSLSMCLQSTPSKLRLRRSGVGIRQTLSVSARLGEDPSGSR